MFTNIKMFIAKSIQNMSTQKSQNVILIHQFKQLKFKKLKKFSKKKEQFRKFLSKCEFYIRFNQKQFNNNTKKVFGIAKYFIEKVFSGFDKYLTKVTKKNEMDGESETKVILNHGNEFKKKLKKMYENIDEVRIAKRQLSNLRQTGSTTKYAVKFQQYATKIDWNDESCMTVYGIKFKNKVKNALILTEKFDDYRTMITKSIEINNHQYEREFEKRKKLEFIHVHGRKQKKNNFSVILEK